MLVREFLEWIDRAPPGRRAEAAHALARAFLHSKVDADTRSAMEAAITVLLDDPAEAVRFSLADALAASPEAPRHVIIALSCDAPEIASVVLARSPLLIDAELVDIAAAGAPPLQVAIARRPRVSGGVAAAIAEVSERDACLALVENAGAAIARISFRRMAERFGEDGEIRAALMRRSGLPVDVRQMLIRRLGDALGTMMIAHAWAGEERAIAVTRDACDRATVALAAETESDELPALVEHLRVTGQLNTALLLRAVCAGNVALFETAVAVLAHAPVERVASLVRAGRTNLLRAIYDKAGLPAVAFDAFAAAIDTWRRFAEEGGRGDRYGVTRRVVEAVLARYTNISDSEVYELATMLRRFAADQAREAARDFARQVRAA
jgi:uncharacterized protein (DUF2336 family)